MDIVVTIPRSEYVNDDAETRHMEIDTDLEAFWTLSRVPRQLQLGDRVYFVRDGRVESSMRCLRIEKNSTTRCETTGRIWSGGCQIFMDDLREENGPATRGFQGFRYRWWEDNETAYNDRTVEGTYARAAGTID